MEALLQNLGERRNQGAEISVAELSLRERQINAQALNAFATCLYDLAKTLPAASVVAQQDVSQINNVLAKSDKNKTTAVDNEMATWLYNLSSTIPSPLDTINLAVAILEACQCKDESQVQQALFDTLGEGERSMEVLFEIAPKAHEIQTQVTENDLRLIETKQNGGTNNDMSSNIDSIDPEEQRLDKLRREAMEAAEFAAITKARVEELAAPGYGSGTTHTVTRASEKEAQKVAKKAAKAAAKALAIAKEAGAIIDENDNGYDQSTLAAEAINDQEIDYDSIEGMSPEEIKMLKFAGNLHPEFTKQFYEEKNLPRGTQREMLEKYERVTIPVAVQDPANLHARIKLSDVMNSREQKAFQGTDSLNPMQSKVFQAAFHSSENLLICAPTGAGKTNVAMLSVVAHLRDKGIIQNDNDPYAAYQHIGVNPDNSNTTSAAQICKKIVYIAPMKALAQEVVEKFSSKLKVLGIIVRELTGDMQLTRAEADRADILVTTPEKWDVVTRKGGDGSLGQTCGLLIIDEVHLLADERGAVIESVVARLHRLVESSQRHIRIVGLSATLPNYKDVATFLRVDHSRGLFYFGPDHRPVPLQQQFVGVLEKKRFLRDKVMNEVCYDTVVDSLKRGYQIMVFVHSRKGTGETAKALTEIAVKRSELDRYFLTIGTDEHGDAHSKFSDRAMKSRNKEVSEHFQNAMGIHHAGMLRNDRKLTEQMFAAGAIKVLCCTATLAWGINLPAHTVVIKGTEVYNPEKGGNVDLSILDVQQIFGRAGRPQYDSSGEAVLITSHEALSRYLDKLVRATPIESNFIKQLADHLNAEIVGGTVTTISEAAQWLQYTYLHVRMMKNPLAYGINASQREEDPMLTKRSMELVQEAAKLLDNHRMIRYDVRSGNLAVTELGRVASHFYIRADSVAIFNNMLAALEDPGIPDLMDLICNATEFENVKVRPEELEEMDSLVKEECPLAVKSPLEEFSGKCGVLMQAYISSTRVKSFTLISDTNYIASNAGRVARALFEMCLKRGMAAPALMLLRIAKSVDKRIWWFQTPLRQFDGELPQNVIRALEYNANATNRKPFDAALSLLDMTPNEVGALCRNSRGGHKIQRLVGHLPQVEVECKVQPVTRGILIFQVHLEPNFEWSGRWHGSGEGFWLWVEDNDNRRIYHNEYILFNKRSHPEPLDLELIIPVFEPLPLQYFIRVVSDSWVGSEMIIPVSFQHLLLPELKMPYTDLLDLTPLPTSALRNKQFEELYSKFETFNPIQTQLFHVLYHTEKNVLLGAPTGSGKTIVAEIALLRMKRINKNAKCVYIAPLKSLARERLKEWKGRLGKAPLRWKVLELSGDTRHDSRALDNADVLVCTPEKWDLISRGWRGNGDQSSENHRKGRKFIKDVRLLVIDEIHLLGEDRGAVLEAIVSRTRFISKFMKSQHRLEDSGISVETRIIGLSTAIANPYDLADWIGIDTKDHSVGTGIGLYNFRPSVRPIPMTVHISGFTGRHYCPRMATMNKPCYAAIKQHSPSKPVIIFVASRRQTRLTAEDLVNYAAGDDTPTSFLGCSDEYIYEVSLTLDDASLRHTITYGIGLHHAGLSSNDREIVEKLYLDGHIQILVATATLAWGVNLPAHLVIVKGTEYFDGKTNRYIDYPVTDVLQMMGRAGRPQFDTSGIACVFVEEGKKNFYKKFLYEPFPVESCFRSRIGINMNAEISIGTITSVDECVGYLDWTFFARRVRLNPSYYGAKSGSDEDITDFFYQIVKQCLDDLKDHGCVLVDDSTEIRTTTLGTASSTYYVDHRTPMQMQKAINVTLRSMMEKKEQDDLTISSNPDKGTEVISFSFPDNIEKLGVSSLLHALSQTHEFDELPVRHNEEKLNLELSLQLPWCDNIVEENMIDPHTKCYLLLQAYITGAQLPISDYINDTKSVIDQIPRLLATMEYVAMDKATSFGSFDLICLFSIVRQVINSKKLAGVNPLSQLQHLPNDGVKKLEQRGFNNLRQLCLLEHSEMSSALKGITGKDKTVKIVEKLKSFPVFTADNLLVEFRKQKGEGNHIGSLKFDLVISSSNGNKRKQNIRKSQHSSPKALNFAMIIGTPQNTLLSRKSVTVVDMKKSVELNFDWNLAKSHGTSSQIIFLRVICEEFRGLDIQYQVPLFG